jgi:hypothetical protein
MGFVIVLLIVLSIVVGYMASNRNRSVVGWVILCIFVSPVITMIILACIGEAVDDVGKNTESTRNYQLHKRVQKLEQKESDKKKCPTCSGLINRDSAFCEFCGANVHEREEEAKKIKQREYEEKGLDALFNDENLMNEANAMRRLYGKYAYISYIKGKAKELGFGDIDISEEDLLQL